MFDGVGRGREGSFFDGIAVVDGLWLRVAVTLEIVDFWIGFIGCWISCIKRHRKSDALGVFADMGRELCFVAGSVCEGIDVLIHQQSVEFVGDVVGGCFVEWFRIGCAHISFDELCDERLERIFLVVREVVHKVLD